MAKSKFSAKEFIKRKYIRGEYAVIPIHIEDKENFYNKYDATHSTISTDLCRYIDASVYNIPIEYKIKLLIDCPNLTEDEKNQMANTIKTHYGLIIHDKELDLKANQRKTLWLMLAGILIVTFYYFHNTNIFSFMKEILLIAGWFSIWEGVDNFVLDRKNIMVDIENTKQFFNSTVEFTKEEAINETIQI